MKRLQRSNGKLRQSFAAQCLNSTAKQRLQQRLCQLDPTQSMVHAWVKRWLGGRGAWRLGMIAPAQNHQLLLLGTAGTGKTTTVRAAVEEVRTESGNFDAVIMVAHTGVAANNMGIGSFTIDNLFKLVGKKNTKTCHRKLQTVSWRKSGKLGCW